MIYSRLRVEANKWAIKSLVSIPIKLWQMSALKWKWLGTHTCFIKSHKDNAGDQPLFSYLDCPFLPFKIAVLCQNWCSFHLSAFWIDSFTYYQHNNNISWGFWFKTTWKMDIYDVFNKTNMPIFFKIIALFVYSISTNIRILVPGAGLGRLAHEIARLGFTCQGNEWSFYMLCASHFVLNR